MSDPTPHTCQIYLVTPGRVAMDSFPELLEELLDETPIAAVRLELETRDPDAIANAADALRGVCHARDVPLILSEHYRMVRNLGLDGTHLMGSRDVRDARKELGDKAIIGTYCGVSRHAGMTAGEISADYVSFGPMSETALGSGDVADRELFEWWSQMIEVPSVAEGGLTPELAGELAPFVDFIALGREVWAADTSPKEALAEFSRRVALA